MCRRLYELSDAELRDVYAMYQHRCCKKHKRFAKDLRTNVMVREIILYLDDFYRTQRMLYGSTWFKHLGKQQFVDYVRITVFRAHF